MTQTRPTSSGEHHSGTLVLLLPEKAASRPHHEEGFSLTLTQFSDETLLHALACGGVWAIEPLYKRYSRLLYAVAYQIVADHQMAENLVQDVFVSVWRRATLYVPHLGTVHSWLLAIMRHRAIDYVRNKGYRSTLKEVAWEQAERDTCIVLPDSWEQTWRSLQSAELRAALLTLPQAQRTVIELAFFQGWTHAEIAAMLHLPLGTVKGRIRLGLQHLKRALEQREGQEW